MAYTPKSWTPAAAPSAGAGGFRPKSWAPAAPAGPTLGEGLAAGGRMLRQGANPFWDEMAGAAEAWKQGASTLAIGALPTPTSTIDAYRKGRDESRAADKRAETELDKVSPAIAPALRVAGGVGVGLLTGGGGYGAAALEGAAGALGSSETDLTRPTGQNVGTALAETGEGAALGAIGKVVGDTIGEGADKVRKYLLRKAGAGKEAAKALAEAQAEDLVGKNVQQARSAAGSAASRARNLVENVEGIDLPVQNAGRTVGARKEAVLGQIDALDDAIESAMAKAQAQGIDPSVLRAGRQGEFLAKGSKFDKAQKAANSIRSLEAAREALVGEYKSLGQRAADELLPDEFAVLREGQAALRSDPRFEDLKQNVLKNALGDFPEVASEAVAKREAFRQALASQEADKAALAERLLSGAEAKEQIAQRAKRYAAPLAGSLFGGGVGAGVGFAVGNDPWDAATFGLAGAGARPAIQALRRMAATPSVQNAAWTALERVAKTAPQSFGRFSNAVAAAVARGPDALKALDKVLRDTSPEWRRLREQQTQQAGQQ